MQIQPTSQSRSCCCNIFSFACYPCRKIINAMLRAFQFLRDLFQKKPKPVENATVITLPTPSQTASVLTVTSPVIVAQNVEQLVSPIGKSITPIAAPSTIPPVSDSTDSTQSASLTPQASPNSSTHTLYIPPEILAQPRAVSVIPIPIIAPSPQPALGSLSVGSLSEWVTLDTASQ